MTISRTDKIYIAGHRGLFGGKLFFHASMPEGTPRKRLDTSKLAAMGWLASIPLLQRMRLVYEDFKPRVGHTVARLLS